MITDINIDQNIVMKNQMRGDLKTKISQSDFKLL
jgi:hypothetical protein